MNVTLSLEDQLVEKVSKIAEERDTTLTDLVRSYLETLVPEERSELEKQRQIEALERSFETLQFRVGERSWTRADLHERS